MTDKASSMDQAAFLRLALVCVEYGCLITNFTGVPIGAEYLGGWRETMLAQFLFFVGLALGCIAARRYTRRRNAPPSTVAGAFLYVGIVFASLILEVLLANPILNTGVLLALSLFVGLSTSLPFMFCYDCMVGILRSRGRMKGAAVPALAQFVSTTIVVAVYILLETVSYAGVLVMGGVAVVVAGCQIALARFGIDSEPTSGAIRDTETYRLTLYSSVLLFCIGFTWSLAYAGISPFIYGIQSEGVSTSAMFVAGAVVLCLSLLAAWKLGTGAHFGGFVRISTALAGFVLALMPALYTLMPQAVFPLCQLVFNLEEIAVVFFSIEICVEKGLHASTVMPVNYSLFVAAMCLGGVIAWAIQAVVDGQTALELISACAVLSIAVLIPFLPSRANDAVAFTLEELPEDEGYDAREARRRNDMVAKYGLSPRESEVLGLLFEGKTRQQIADELILSPWTVKEYISSIYSKAGVHSFKELTRLTGDE